MSCCHIPGKYNRITLTLLQCPRRSLNPPRLLDLHVPPLPLHLPRRRHARHRSRQQRNQMLLHRTRQTQPTPRPNLHPIHGRLHQPSRRLPRQQRHHHQLRILHRRQHKRLPQPAQLGVFDPVAQFRHHVGVYHLQHLCRSVSLLVGSCAEEAEGAGGGAGRFDVEDCN